MKLNRLLLFVAIFVISVNSTRHLEEAKDHHERRNEHHREHHHQRHHPRKIIYPSVFSISTKMDSTKLIDYEIKTIEDSFQSVFGFAQGGCVDPKEVTQAYLDASKSTSEVFFTSNYNETIAKLKAIVDENMKKAGDLSHNFHEKIEDGPDCECSEKYLKLNDKLFDEYFNNIQNCVNSIGGSSTAVAKNKVVSLLKTTSQWIVTSFANIGFTSCSGLGSSCDATGNPSQSDALCACQKAVSSFFAFF